MQVHIDMAITFVYKVVYLPTNLLPEFISNENRIQSSCILQIL
jgi:hypothetical protein